MEATRRHLEAAHSVYVVCHIIPDGDAIGSLLGLGWALRQLGKRCTMACADPVPPRFDFLAGTQEVVSDPPGDEEIIVAVDSSDTERLGSLYDALVFQSRPVINIDHHVTNIRFGTVNCVQPLPSTAEIIFSLTQELGVALDKRIAAPLLTGLVADTRCFRTGNVTSQQLHTAIALMDAGASMVEITENVFSRKPVAAICLWGRALINVRTRGRIMWTEIDQDAQRECAASPDSGTGLVSFLASTQGVDIALVFRETPDGDIEVSMRAGPGWDVSGAALRLGGGGHPRAAGCTLPGDMSAARERALLEIQTVLREQAGA
ncbi:MAG TPA: DHH family phosphoesterase [Anaerolineae bacterium]|nr:DHH family phosphoesterase [Anaerolineae bacterium]